MKEELLQYLWKIRMAQYNNLYTTDGRELHIINPGCMHQDAGPDFKQAIIRVDDMIWAGDVEIHINSSDWYKHHHHQDDKYLSVILHVVYKHDVNVFRKDQEIIPALELKNYIPQQIIDEYQKLTLSTNLIACSGSLDRVPPLVQTSIISSMAVGRLLRRQQQLLRMLKNCHDDWNELTYRVLLVNFGFNVNATAFELLAQSLPYRILQRHQSSRTQVYALLFGQAGLLSEDREEHKYDEYYILLKNEYEYLRYKYGLTPIEAKLWNLLRLRPTNFPCVRIAQVSELLFSMPDIFREVIYEASPGTLKDKISGVCPADYWSTHFQFGVKTKLHHCHIGKTAYKLLLINTVVPLMFTYGSFSGNERMKSVAVDTLEILGAENNHITRLFQTHHFPVHSALFSQALLELYSGYCKHHACHACPIGQYIITH